MGDKVDVLDELRGVIRITKAASVGVTGNAPRIAKAEAAVAALSELIEADRGYDDAQFGLARARYNGEPLEAWIDGCAKSDIRRAAALAKVGGAK